MEKVKNSDETNNKSYIASAEQYIHLQLLRTNQRSACTLPSSC